MTQPTCPNCRHEPHRRLRNPLMRAYERLRPPGTCQVWVDRTTWWDGELCRCPDEVHRATHADHGTRGQGIR